MQKNGGMSHSVNLMGFPWEAVGTSAGLSCCHHSSCYPHAATTESNLPAATHHQPYQITNHSQILQDFQLHTWWHAWSWAITFTAASPEAASAISELHELYPCASVLEDTAAMNSYLSLSWCNGKCCSHELYLWASITWYILLHKQACN